jgi:hypothetical protein
VENDLLKILNRIYCKYKTKNLCCDCHYTKNNNKDCKNKNNLFSKNTFWCLHKKIQKENLKDCDLINITDISITFLENGKHFDDLDKKIKDMNVFFKKVSPSYSINNYEYKNLINLVPSIDNDLSGFMMLLKINVEGFKDKEIKKIDNIDYMFYLIPCKNYEEIDDIISKSRQY